MEKNVDFNNLNGIWYQIYSNDNFNCNKISMLTKLPISELIKLRQDEEVEDSGSGEGYPLQGLMESFDNQPEDAGDEDNNKLMGLIGLILQSLGLGGGASAGFFGSGTYGIGNYISWALTFLAYVANFWGWWKYIDSTLVPREDTTFRSWRVNMLAGLLISIIAVWNLVSVIIWWSTYTTALATAGGSLLLALVVGVSWAYALACGPLRARCAPGLPAYPRSHAICFHLGVVVVLLSVIGTGVFMLFKIGTPNMVPVKVIAKNPYLLTQPNWDIVYGLHGLAAAAMAG